MKNEIQLMHGDCLERLKELPDNSVDSVVTDPPYGLSFMGKKWDYDVPSEDIWRECLRVLKPGGHLLAFAGTRTQHRMAVRIEDAGFEIRDMIAWVYGSGFPKSHDVSKAIDKAGGAEREVVGLHPQPGGTKPRNSMGDGWQEAPTITAPATAEAQQWSGWGTALKPALEPITVARKPFGGTVAENVLTHGTGAINVDGCRVGDEVTVTLRNGNSGAHGKYGKDNRVFSRENSPGRWPANLIHDGSDEVVGLFPVTTSGSRKGGIYHDSNQQGYGFKPSRTGTLKALEGDTGSAARFFYCAKASKRDRDEGCDGLDLKPSYMVENGSKTAAAANGVRYDRTTTQRNNHPTVKPTDLMRYLCRLVTSLGGIVLDPFMGSGSTGKAAILEGFNFIGIEREAEYLEIAKARIKAAQSKAELQLV